MDPLPCIKTITGCFFMYAGLPILLTEEEETVLVGSAILAVAAAGNQVTIT